MAKNARSLAYGAYHETCPYVDEAFYTMLRELNQHMVEGSDVAVEKIINTCIERVKVQTNGLRSVLIDAYQEMLDNKSEHEIAIDRLERTHQKELDQLGS